MIFYRFKQFFQKFRVALLSVDFMADYLKLIEKLKACVVTQQH